MILRITKDYIELNNQELIYYVKECDCRLNFDKLFIPEFYDDIKLALDAYLFYNNQRRKYWSVHYKNLHLLKNY